MLEKPMISRRGFIVGAAAGAASLGVRSLPNTLADTAKDAKPQPLLLNRNESPYGLPPASIEAIQKVGLARSNRYPGAEARVLAEAIAKRFEVDKEQVLLGCGSTEILKMATEAFCSSSRSAVVAEPTFEAVVNYCPLARARSVKIPVTRQYQHNLPRMWRHAANGGGMIFFCNPSNPTGTIIGKEQVEKFVRRLPRRVVLLADEAYWDFVEDPEFESCLRYVKEGRPVVISRTFSKVYGMAGLRLGYAIGPKALIKQMAKRKLGNNPNQIAAAAGLAALGEREFVARVRRLNAESRDYLCRELSGMGLPFIPSHTNFVMVDLGRPSKDIIEALKKRDVMVGRVFPAMPNHLRVSIGTKEDMQRFIGEFKDVMHAP